MKFLSDAKKLASIMKEVNLMKSNKFAVAALIFGIVGVIADFVSTKSMDRSEEDRYRQIAQEEAEKVYNQKTEGR